LQEYNTHKLFREVFGGKTVLIIFEQTQYFNHPSAVCVCVCVCELKVIYQRTFHWSWSAEDSSRKPNYLTSVL